MRCRIKLTPLFLLDLSCFVLNFICMLVSGLHPLIWILMPMNIAIVTGIPFFLMCAKVQKFGAVLIMGLVTGLLYYVTG